MDGLPRGAEGEFLSDGLEGFGGDIFEFDGGGIGEFSSLDVAAGIAVEHVVQAEHAQRYLELRHLRWK